jgi:hypothetical protein
MQSLHDLKTIADDELLRRLAALLTASRHSEADLVAHIGEVDARRLYVLQATPSMFVYCTERLHLSEAEACLRISAGRASRQHPALLEMLADGRLHLAAIAKLAPYLTPENRDELLRRATHKSKREVEELIAEIAPRPDVPGVIRKLPAGRLVARPVSDRFGFRGATHSPDAGLESPFEDGLRPERVDSDRLGVVDGHGAGLGVEGKLGSRSPDHAGLPWVAGRPRPAVIEPLAPSRYKVQFTASADLRAKLEKLQALMRSSIPGGDLAAVIEAAVSEKLERLEARRFGRTKSPRKPALSEGLKTRTLHVPAAVRRAVSERDEDRCRFVDAAGHRCSARVFVQLHHRKPWAVGGEHSTENCSLSCKVHNRLMAEVDFGREAVGKHRRSSVAAGAPQVAPKTA